MANETPIEEFLSSTTDVRDIGAVTASWLFNAGLSCNAIPRVSRAVDSAIKRTVELVGIQRGRLAAALGVSPEHTWDRLIGAAEILRDQSHTDYTERATALSEREAKVAERERRVDVMLEREREKALDESSAKMVEVLGLLAQAQDQIKATEEKLAKALEVPAPEPKSRYDQGRDEFAGLLVKMAQEEMCKPEADVFAQLVLLTLAGASFDDTCEAAGWQVVDGKVGVRRG